MLRHVTVLLGEGSQLHSNGSIRACVGKLIASFSVDG
jgi:hypothetical protein